MEAVSPALEFGAPAANEFALFVENQQGLAGLTGAMHGVGDVDVALGVFADAVRVAEREGTGEATPIVDGFVGVGATAENRKPGAAAAVRKVRRCTVDAP